MPVQPPRHLEFTDDGIRLDAVLEMPEDFTGSCPLVIVLHGFTGHKEERHILGVSEAIRDCGCATLRADLYGHGLSGGTFQDHTLFRWIQNIFLLVDRAREMPFVSSIWLCGHSQGGLSVLLAGALKCDQIMGIIALSPACMIPEGARSGNLLGIHFDPEHVPDTLPAWGDRTLGGNYVRVAQSIRTEDVLPNITVPVLVVHGDADDAVPAEVGAESAALCPRGEFVSIPGDTHCYDHHLPSVQAAVRDWLKAHVLGHT
ncbi:MAG: alpha/beta fold hydrolase [Clostridia bacterium]|nr:alpha/beta fold hydrolase [Clostridia bacterium]